MVISIDLNNMILYINAKKKKKKKNCALFLGQLHSIIWFIGQYNILIRELK